MILLKNRNPYGDWNLPEDVMTSIVALHKHSITSLAKFKAKSTGVPSNHTPEPEKNSALVFYATYASSYFIQTFLYDILYPKDIDHHNLDKTLHLDRFI